MPSEFHAPSSSGDISHNLAHVRLGVNIDHVATLRNARGGRFPDPVAAAKLAVECGADGITAHLREDRRHIRDADIARIRAEVEAPLNFEMAATDEMVGIALKTKPHACCLVPEKRTELTTEGGLDAHGLDKALAPVVSRLSDGGIRVSLFIDAEPTQIETAARLKAPVIELHTGTLAEAHFAGDVAQAEAEYERLRRAATLAGSLGLEVHAGHGLDFTLAEQMAAIPEIRELNIGHFLIGQAVFTGLPAAIETMIFHIKRGRAAVLAGGSGRA
jgi:pyridoxine 5-phosphate synthase